LTRFLLTTAMLVALMPTVSHAFCSEPSKPWSKPSKPSVPFCVNEWAKTHTCDDWEINSYNSAIQDYNRQVEAYIEALRRYVDEAVEYANCEIGSLDG